MNGPDQKGGRIKYYHCCILDHCLLFKNSNKAGEKKSFWNLLQKEHVWHRGWRHAFPCERCHRSSLTWAVTSCSAGWKCALRAEERTIPFARRVIHRKGFNHTLVWALVLQGLFRPSPGGVLTCSLSTSEVTLFVCLFVCADTSTEEEHK